jgi:hypothetical protein
VRFDGKIQLSSGYLNVLLCHMVFRDHFQPSIHFQSHFFMHKGQNSHLQEFVAQTVFFLCIALPTLQTFNINELWSKFDLERGFLGQGGHI